jgi:RIO-like serine/threonine protein kinase
MEIDHLFAIHKVLNSVVLQGDETFRVMQELAKLTNDHD